MDLNWPLVSRDEELRTISGALANGAVGAGGPRGVIIVGASGAGRTRLLRTVMQEQRAAGRPVISVATTTASAAVPFGAVAHLVPPGVGVGHPGMYELLAAAISVDHPPSGPVIAVDDAHLLDDASAGLPHFLATHGRCSLLLTALMGAALPDTLVALWKDGLVVRRQLDPLPVEAVDELLAHTLDGPLLSPARAYLHRQCGGYPLDLRELLLAGRVLGVLRRHGAAWNWSGRVGTAPRLVEVVEARMRAVRPQVRSVVELVACGEPLPITAVESHVGLPAAEEAGLVRVVTDGMHTQLRLTHPLDAEVLRDTMARARARRAYRTLATWLGATPMRRTDDHVRLATWRLAAGLSVPTRQLRTAIRAAMTSHDLASAQRLAQAAAQSGDVAGTLLLADVDFWLGAHPAGADAPVPSDQHAAGPAGPATGAGRADPRWTALRARTLYWPLGRAAEAMQLLRVSPLAGVTPAMTATRAMMLLFDSQLEPAIDTADGLIRRPDAPAEAVLWAYVATVAGNAMRGRTLLALDLAADGLRLAARSNRGGPAAAYLRLAYGDALRLAGRLAQAWPHARQGYQ